MTEKLGLHFKGEKVTVTSRLGTEMPYTVIKVMPKTLMIQRCDIRYYRPHYFDDEPDEIVPDEKGVIVKLCKDKCGNWHVPNRGGYARFGEWRYSPYMD